MNTVVWGKPITYTESLTDVVSGDTVTQQVPNISVLVTAQTDLANLPPYPAGTIAYTAGFGNMWQLSAAGEWVAIVEEAGN